MNTSILVPFHGNTLYLVEHDGEAYTPMKPIVEGMGLTWQAQHRKLAERFKSTITEMMMVAEDGKQRLMTCIPLRKLTGWLYTISPNKVRPELRARIIAYQEECDDVLWDYWNRGHAASPRYRPEETREVHALGLTREQQDTIKSHHRALVEAAPKTKQAKLAITLWSSIKSKFGVSYKDVPASDFAGVISLMSRVAIEGEWIPAEPAAKSDCSFTLTEREGASLHGVFTMVDLMREMMKRVEPPLRLLGSDLAPKVYDSWHEIGLFLPDVKPLRDFADKAYRKQLAA